LTRGRAATTDPFDISAVRRSDELFDALATRRLVDPGNTDSDDPAAGLLAALVADVDGGAPPLPASSPARVACAATSGGSCRRGVRAIVTFGVAAVVLTSAGAAAAGGNTGVRAMDSNRGSEWLRVAERSNENVRHQEAPGEFLVSRKPAGGPDDRRGISLYDAAPDARARRTPHKPAKAAKTNNLDKGKDKGKGGKTGNGKSAQGGNATLPKVESTATDAPPPRSYGPHQPPSTPSPSPEDRAPVDGQPQPDGS
jgi:hypothetical protein